MSDTRAVAILGAIILIVMMIGMTISEYVKAQMEAQLVKACIEAGGEWEPNDSTIAVCRRHK